LEVEQKLVYEQTIEGLFQRGLKERLSPRLLLRLKEAGLDLRARLLPAYPFDDWCRFVQIAAEELYPSLSQEEAYLALGEAVVKGFGDTLLGPALFTVLRIVGPRRALQRTAKNFRSGNNYTEARLVEKGESHFELWMNEAGPIHHLTRGILTAGLLATGAKQPTVRVASFDDASVTYEIRW